MRKFCLLTSAIVFWAPVFSAVALAEEGTFEYPCYLIDAYHPEEACWWGFDTEGEYPETVVPELLLVGPPLSEFSAVSLATDHWVELKFCGELVDEPEDSNDILLIEWDPMGEQALVFVTDGCDNEYLLGLAEVPKTYEHVPTEIGFDIAGISLPFVPCAVRIVGTDEGGGSHGFDLGSVRAQINTNFGEIAWNPSPFDGIENVSPDVVLSWSPGCSADKHTVYFGGTLNDVDTDASAVSNPTQPQEANSYDPNGLELGKSYYWRIDEVNDGDVNSTWTGDVWSFTVAEYIVVDDFEDYNDQPDEIQIWRVWKEGFGYIGYCGNGTGSSVGANTDSTTEETIVRGCGKHQSMPYYYDNTATGRNLCEEPITLFYSEAERTFEPPQDWTADGVRALSLWFYGTSNNDADATEQLYVKVNDAKVLYDGDMNDIREETWHEWNVDLAEFSVDLTTVTTLGIGFGDEDNTTPGGTGKVYFDDIRLYPSICLEENRPDADFNADCAVDFKDVEEMTYSWLNKSYNIYPVAAPNDPLAWYRFDGNANDSAGNADGQLSGSPSYVPGIYGQAISFDSHEDSVEITNAANLFSNINNAITIAFWQYGADSTHHTDTVCCSNYTYGSYNPTIAINLGCWRRPGEYNWDCGYPWSFDNRLDGNHRYESEWLNRWNHWAFTKDSNREAMEIYLNGVLYDSKEGTCSPISEVNSFEIGSGWYGSYDGLLDDFRIYDYALSQAEIVYAATNGTGVFDQPLMSPADLYPDEQINFNDFVILAGSWLDEQLWP